MTKKCSASHCITGSTRSSKVLCASCKKSFHLKCIGLSTNQYKGIRDVPGAEWFCPACRNSSYDIGHTSVNPAFNLIMDRLSSVLRLVGAQIDVTRSLCRALSNNIRRENISIRPAHTLPCNESRTFEDEINNLQLEFTNVFGSFIADTENTSDTKRDRSSSLSSSHLTSSRSSKKMRVEVPVSTSASTATIIPSIPDADIPPALVINEGPIPTIIECNEPQIIPSNTCLIAKDTNLAQTITTAIIPANSIATNHATPATPSASIIASTSITAQQQQLQATLAPSASIILRSTDKCTQTESSPKPQRPRAPAAAVAVSDVSIHPSMSEAITANTAVFADPVLPSMNPATFSTTATVTNPTPSVQQSMTPLQHDVIDLTNATSSDVFVNEVGNDLAQVAVDVALNYIRKNPSLGLSVELLTVEGNRTDSKGLLESLCSKYSEALNTNRPPHVIFDTTLTGVSSETVKSISAALGIPTVSASTGQEGDLRQWRSLSTVKSNYLLQVMPPTDIIPEVIRSIVTYMNITNAAILYDETFVMDHKYKALLQNFPTRHVITAIGNDRDRAEQIEKLRNLDINNFFILGSFSSIKKVLESAKREFFERNFAWHAITQYQGELSSNIENATIMLLRPVSDSKSKDRLGVIRTTYNMKQEPQITTVFYFDLALRTFLAIKNILQVGAWPPNMKYLTCDEYDGTNSPNHTIDLKSAFIEVTEPTTYGPFQFPKGKTAFNGHSYMKFDMDISAVTIRGGASVSTRNLGKWEASLDNALYVTNEDDMKNLTADIVYRVYTVVQEPFIIRDPTAPKGFKGYCIDLLDEIAKIVKFDYEIKEVEDGKFGNMNEKGEWNGIVRKLIDKQADIGLGSMSVMAERETVIDFTVPYYDLVGISIMMLLPSTPSSLFKFLTVLETNVWLCILAAYFFTSFLMWIFDRYSPYSYQNNREKYKNDDEKREFNIKECLWFCMTSLTPQGGGEAPKNLSGRLVAATWWLFGFIIIASYTANLAAFLTVSRLDTPVESLDDLSKQYKILYAPLNGSSAMTYFQRMADIEARFYEIWKEMSLNDSLTPVERSKLAVWDYPVSDKYTKMWQAMQEAGLPNSLDEAVERIRNSTSASGFAFLGDATDIRYKVLTNCDLQMVGEEFSRKPYAIAVQQGSPLKDQFNNAILMLLNKRQLEKLKEQWWKNDDIQSKCEKPDDQSDGISIQNIGGVFIVIFVGIGMACITLVFEFWYYKYRKNVKIIDVAEATDEKLAQKPSNLMLPNLKSEFGQMKDDNQKTQSLRTRTQTLDSNNFKSRF